MRFRFQPYSWIFSIFSFAAPHVLPGFASRESGLHWPLRERQIHDAGALDC